MNVSSLLFSAQGDGFVDAQGFVVPLVGQLLVTFDSQTRNLAEEILLCYCVTTIMDFELKAIKCKELPIFMTSTCSY